MKYKISVKEQEFHIEVGEIRDGMARVKVNGMDYDVRVEEDADGKPSIENAPSGATAPLQSKAPPASPVPPLKPAAPMPSAAPSGDGNMIKAPMPGLILDIKVKPGDTVSAGMTVVVMEAMKMENSITARVDGIVREVHVQKGAQVMTGAPLLVIG